MNMNEQRRDVSECNFHTISVSSQFGSCRVLKVDAKIGFPNGN